MKKIFMFFLLLLCFGCGNEPKLYFPSSEILMGSVKLGSEKAISIPIINKGKKELIIKNVNSSCKCIDIKFPKNEISSGQEDYLTMTFKADKLGHHSETIIIESNDPSKSKLINIQVNVIN